MGNKHPFWEKV